MPDFEQVCRRLFSDSAWLAKCLLGAVLMAIPILHFFAFGYLGRVAAAAARGEPFDLPDWEGWGELFVSGIIFFAIFLGLGGGLFLLAFLVSLPFEGWAGPLAYIPFIPAALLAPPLVAAGWYRYVQLGRVVEGFRVGDLFRLLQRSGFALILPTFAYIGFLVVGLPLFPLAFFAGGLVVFFFYSSIFCHAESRESGASAIPFSVL